MSTRSFSKSEIIYRRLFEEYDDYSSIDDFMAEFDLTRQSFYDRTKSKKLDYDSIRKALPLVNLEWLYSESETALTKLPVRFDLTDNETISDTNNENTFIYNRKYQQTVEHKKEELKRVFDDIITIKEKHFEIGLKDDSLSNNDKHIILNGIKARLKEIINSV